MQSKKLVLASNNKGKLREFQAMFDALGLTIVGQGALGVSACEEPFNTFVENCLQKARHASRETGLPAMADDSGLCVDALAGAPGVFSARFAGEPSDDEKNNANRYKSYFADKDANKADYHANQRNSDLDFAI